MTTVILALLSAALMALLAGVTTLRAKPHGKWHDDAHQMSREAGRRAMQFSPLRKHRKQARTTEPVPKTYTDKKGRTFTVTTDYRTVTATHDGIGGNIRISQSGRTAGDAWAKLKRTLDSNLLRNVRSTAAMDTGIDGVTEEDTEATDTHVEERTRSHGVFAMTSRVFLFGFLLNWYLLHRWFHPSLTSHDVIEWISWELALTAILSFIVMARRDIRTATPFVAAALALALPIGNGIINMLPYGADKAHRLAALAQPTFHKDPLSIPPTSDDHIVGVHAAAAQFKAHNVMGTPGINSYYDLGASTMQVIKGHVYYVFDLRIDGYRDQNNAHHMVPGYIQVDAQDGSLPAKVVTGYDIKYVPGGSYGMNLERLVYNDKRYLGYHIDGFTFQLDESGRPFYTTTLDTPFTRSNNFIPRRFLIVDPQTGTMTDTALDKVPAWAERVFSAKMAKWEMEQWGHWGLNPSYWWSPLNLGQGKNNRYHAAEGDPVLVYTDAGMAWQVQMVSYRNDKVVGYLAYMDTRTGKTDIYVAPSGLSNETSVAKAFDGITNNTNKFVLKDPAVHKIRGVLVLIGGTIPEAHADDDQYSDTGVGVVPVSSIDSLNATYANSVDGVLDALSTKLTQPGTNKGSSADSKGTSIPGVIADSSIVAVSTNASYLVFYLYNPGNPPTVDNQHVYRMAITSRNVIDAGFAKPGRSVIVDYVDSNEKVREVNKVTVAPLANTMK